MKLCHFIVMWRDLESVIQSEGSQKEKKNKCIWNLEKWYR